MAEYYRAPIDFNTKFVIAKQPIDKIDADVINAFQYKICYSKINRLKDGKE